MLLGSWVALSVNEVLAETVATTDGVITVTESVAPLGRALTYLTGGDGLIGVAGSYPTMADTPTNRAFAANVADHTWLQYDPQIVCSPGTLTRIR